jgi:dephospho-CoA kinase
LQKLQELKTEETFPKTVVLDIPLLLESGWDKLCHEIIFVATPESVRIQYASSRGWSHDDYLARQAMQMTLAEKEKRSSVVFNNTGTLEDLRSQVSYWFQETLRKLRE